MGAEESNPERRQIPTLANVRRAREWDRTFRERPLRIPKLLRPRANVVPTRIAQHVLQRLLFGNISPRLADDNREFSLVIARSILTKFRHADFLRVGSAQRCSWLDE